MKESLRSSRWTFQRSIVPADSSGSRKDKMKPFPLKDEEIDAPMFLEI